MRAKNEGETFEFRFLFLLLFFFCLLFFFRPDFVFVHFLFILQSTLSLRQHI